PEELLHGQGREFYAEYIVALFGQPDHVAGFSAQGNKHPGRAIDPQPGPELLQGRGDPVLVKAGLAFTPAFKPEISFHGSYGPGRWGRKRAWRCGAWNNGLER